MLSVVGVFFALSGRASAGEPGAANGSGGESAFDKRTAAVSKFTEGERAFKVGDFLLAAQLFEEAYRLAPHEDALWNAARAHDRAGDSADAANLYAQYLREAPPGANDRGNAVLILRQLSGKLGRIEIHKRASTSARVDGKPTAVDLVFVNPGAHVVSGDPGAGEGEQSVSVAAGAIVSVTLIAKTGNEPVKVVSGSPLSPPLPPPAAPPSSHEPSRVPLILTATFGGLTIVGAGLTIASGLDTLSARRTFLDARSQANYDEGISKENRTNAALGVTIVLAAATIGSTIWLLASHRSEPSLDVGVGPGKLEVSGRF